MREARNRTYEWEGFILIYFLFAKKALLTVLLYRRGTVVCFSAEVKFIWQIRSDKNKAKKTFGTKKKWKLRKNCNSFIFLFPTIVVYVATISDPAQDTWVQIKGDLPRPQRERYL